MFWFCAWKCKEIRDDAAPAAITKAPEKKKEPIIKSLKALSRNNQLILAIFSVFVGAMGAIARMSMLTYYLIYVSGAYWNNDFQYGDWLMPSAVKSGLQGPAMMKLTGYEAATLMYVYTNRLMEKICRALGKEDKAEDYHEIAQKTCEAFMAEFGNEDGTLKKEFQGLYVLALAMNVIPESKRENAVKKLAELIHSNGDRLDTGFLSIPFLLPVLHENGLTKLANTLLFQDQSPFWLYEVSCGATTLWESWDAIDENGNPKDYSMNHFAFGCVGEYLFKYLAGIKNAGTAFNQVRIEPDFDCGLTYVNAQYDSIYGNITVNWNISNGKKEIRISPPRMYRELL